MKLASHTIFNATALASHLKNEYDIGTIESCHLWRCSVNDVFRLEANGRQWWLRIHPYGWRTPSQTHTEIDSLLQLAKAGASVVRPVARTTGDYLLALEAAEGSRTAVLFEHAAGVEVSYLGPEGTKNASRYGCAAAKLHDACDTLRTSAQYMRIDLDFILLDPIRKILPLLGAEERAYLLSLSRKLTELIQAHTLTTGFCHGDLNSSNIHFSDNGPCVFDFDCSGWGWRAFELAAFARGMTWSSGPTPANQALISAYFDGYRSQHTVTADDFSIQSAMLLVQRIWVTALHLSMASRIGSFYFGPPYAVKLVEWLRLWEPELKSRN
ncbi:hypothetical protein CDH05_26480 [Pseudomonas lactis]|uniref:phosphotransferase enzyme family protein n=1 Tax=Pseudomonas lactis TaxID=1615674 RepID=UPI000B6B6322|nr:phosphotransferase [Pseudomonas lactis]OWQ38573.1 hypothetical protein CDH05_26480 [Pseudomonas lactis]